MRKIIVSLNITLDGFIAAENGSLDWHFPYWNDEMEGFALWQLSGMDTILLGRKTYEAMAAYWPGERGAFACLMNDRKKVVLSHTMANATWENTVLIKKDAAKRLLEMKQESGRDMIIYGSGSTLLELMKQELVDELRLWIHPLTLGKGIPLFRREQREMNLLSTKAFDNGVLITTYGVNVNVKY